MGRTTGSTLCHIVCIAHKPIICYYYHRCIGGGEKEDWRKLTWADETEVENRPIQTGDSQCLSKVEKEKKKKKGSYVCFVITEEGLRQE